MVSRRTAFLMLSLAMGNQLCGMEKNLNGDVKSHYSQGTEEKRLFTGLFQLERVRTESILKRFLPKAPATIVDIGGGAGVYALPLAKQGYDVHLIDFVPLHIEQAKEAEKKQMDHPLKSCTVGDARNVELPDAMADVVLLMGPLYHLTEKKDRIKALEEAYRILKPGGLLLAASIVRCAAVYDSLIYGTIEDPVYVNIAMKDLETGQHRNPTENKYYFTNAYFHEPEELKKELSTVGLTNVSLLGIEGPGWIMPDFDKHWKNPKVQEALLSFAEKMESNPTYFGTSAHLMAIGKK